MVLNGEIRDALSVASVLRAKLVIDQTKTRCKFTSTTGFAICK
jgi:hypothetical protein